MSTNSETQAGARLAEAVRAYANARTIGESAVAASALIPALAEYDAATKPRTITVNGIEVPEPVREAPEVDNWYWRPCIDGDELMRQYAWRGDDMDKRWLSRGLIHRTREAAEAHARALLAASEERRDG